MPKLPSLETDPASLPATPRGYARRYARAYVLGGLCLAAFQLALNRIDWLSKATVNRIFAPPVEPLVPVQRRPRRRI